MSTINVSNLNDGTTTVGTTYITNGSAKAWANTGSGTTTRGSFNLSSLTDNGTGDYTYNFTSSMNNNDFTTTTSAFRDNDAYTGIYFDDQTTSRTKTRHYDRGTTTRGDVDSVYIVINGDLA